ncbi:hypothetical protein WJX72_002197 [[Myrmecia] bisecta]|uniref:UBZ4-type domain-containing protein n=1 Tax=[Myrmecia] bisecta TaxID=41462 RepID=A0AAW1PPB8_9CHLO
MAAEPLWPHTATSNSLKRPLSATCGQATLETLWVKPQGAEACVECPLCGIALLASAVEAHFQAEHPLDAPQPLPAPVGTEACPGDVANQAANAEAATPAAATWPASNTSLRNFNSHEVVSAAAIAASMGRLAEALGQSPYGLAGAKDTSPAKLSLPGAPGSRGAKHASNHGSAKRAKQGDQAAKPGDAFQLQAQGQQGAPQACHRCPICNMEFDSRASNAAINLHIDDCLQGCCQDDVDVF